jgi:hypothetical protein
MKEMAGKSYDVGRERKDNTFVEACKVRVNYCKIGVSKEVIAAGKGKEKGEKMKRNGGLK